MLATRAARSPRGQLDALFRYEETIDPAQTSCHLLTPGPRLSHARHNKKRAAPWCGNGPVYSSRKRDTQTTLCGTVCRCARGCASGSARGGTFTLRCSPHYIAFAWRFPFYFVIHTAVERLCVLPLAPRKRGPGWTDVVLLRAHSCGEARLGMLGSAAGRSACGCSGRARESEPGR